MAICLFDPDGGRGKVGPLKVSESPGGAQHIRSVGEVHRHLVTVGHALRFGCQFLGDAGDLIGVKGFPPGLPSQASAVRDIS